MEGEGTYIWSDGKKYVGSWSRNTRKGFGIMILQDGKYYKGEWDNDERYGQGEFHWGPD